MKVIVEKIRMLWEKGAFHVIIGNFLTKFIAFFGSIFLVNRLTKEDYGLLSYIENIYGYIFIFAGLGLGNALLRYVILADDKEMKYSIYRYTVVRGSIINVILILLVSLIVFLFDFENRFNEAKYFLPILLLALPFHYVLENNLLLFRAMLMNRWFALLTVLTSFFLISFQIIGASFFDLEGVVYFKLFVYVILSVVVYYIIKKNMFKDNKNKSLINKKFSVEINKFSIQYMITNGIWVLFMLNDIFLLGLLIGEPAIIAEYKVAYIFSANLSIISTAIGVFVGPYFVKNEKNNSWVWGNYKKLILTMFLIITPVAFILIVFSRQIIILFFGEDYSSATYIMRILTVSAYINCVFRYTTAHLIASMGKVNYNLIISLIGIIFQIILNIILIPNYGAEGVAITSVLVYFIMSVALIFVFTLKYRCSEIK